MWPFFDQEQWSLRSRVRSWVDAHLVATGEPVNVEEAARRLVLELGKEEFLAFTVPAEYGGKRAKVQARDLCILREQLARGSALADGLFALQALGSCPVILAGSEQQKRTYLPRVASGEAVAAFALTEPEAGSDVASLQTRALKLNHSDFALSGTKRFISNAGIAAHYVVFASTAPEKRGKGISAFMIDASTPGLVVKEKTAVMSPHPLGVIALENCVVGADALLGAEGEGLNIAYGSLDILRCTVGAAALGLAQRALDEALHYCRERRQFGRAIGEFQGIQFKLADMATELEAARLLVYQAAWSHDCAKADARVQSSMAKLYATEAAQRIIDQALQLHGGVGLVSGSIMERLYRDVRALRIYEGTSEIQKVIIARELLKATGNRQ
jgi:acyl-CoA dehydrogenase